MGDYRIAWAVFWPFAAAVISYIIGKYDKAWRNHFASAAMVMEFTWLLFLYPHGSTAEFTWAGFCEGGIYLKADGFRWLYGMIAAFMWMMTTLFSEEYFRHYRNRNRYYFFMLMTCAATIGVFLSSNLFTTFLFFEIMSMTSFVMVIHEETKMAKKAAGTYLAIAVIGGLSALFGLFMIYAKIGTLDMGQIGMLADKIGRGPLFYTAGILILVGFGAKAGMYPLHVWLPNAHPVAPAPASALLSGILTKAGMFGVLVISSTMFFHDVQWGRMILVLGTITMVLGAVLAVFTMDLKRTLACSSMSQIGFILVGVGMQGLLGEHNALAVRGTLLHMVNHSLIKLVLFMAAGCIYMNLHKLNLNDIRGYGRGKPFLTAVFAMGTLGIMGIPLWNGYVSKTLLHESIVEYIAMAGERGWNTAPYHVLEWLFLTAGGLTVAYMTKLFIAIFIEKPAGGQECGREKAAYINMESRIALGLSAALLPALGMLPGLTMDRIADLGQGFMGGISPEHQVAYFSAVNLKGAVISMVIGSIVYIVVIRGMLMERAEDGTMIYVERWPARLDLEETVYRPVVLRFLPFWGAFFARVVNALCEGGLTIILKRKERMRTVRPKEDTGFFEGTQAVKILTWCGLPWNTAS
ncbi:complex I subunit 5 family protein [Clostridium sp. AM58-1XD]|uniref:complex I subunit 5 family protein n=1 Tax=Clostridium sp. AM58-1XD TaxID=2292307 RepID=UPI001FA8693D|nr:complex I subunit 5 family protein [Clostridium sp. AM58-1XD]